MSEVIDANGRDESLKTFGHISYLLHTIVAVGAVIPGAQASTLLLIIAGITDLVKRGEAAGTWQESHFSGRSRTVVWAAILYAVTFPLFLLMYIPGAIAWTLISIWFLYRVVRGWMRLGASEAMPS